MKERKLIRSLQRTDEPDLSEQDLSIVQNQSLHHRKDSSSTSFSTSTSKKSAKISRKRSRSDSFSSNLSCIVISPESTPLTTFEDDTKTLPKSGYASVGLVFEAAPRHYYERLHKERPSRIASIRQSLQISGWLDQCTILEDQGVKEEEQQRRFQEAIRAVHSEGYLRRLENLGRCSCLRDEESQYDSIYLTKHTYQDSQNAVASLLSLVDQVMRNNLKNGFACIRPPGHHAKPGLAGGFCIVNNVAVAAQYALQNGKQNEKIVILDWDVHHGNGTQSIFWNSPDVLYISIHVQKTFPFSSSLKTAQSIGGHEAKGKTVNVAWSSDGMGNEEYLAAMQHLILPIIKEFKPSLTLISAGFDAAMGDVGKCQVTPAGFGLMTSLLLDTLKEFNCPAVATLEGGYRLSILGECVTNVVAAMAKYNKTSPKERRKPEILDVALDTICPIAAKDIQATRNALKPYWKCF